MKRVIIHIDQHENSKFHQQIFFVVNKCIQNNHQKITSKIDHKVFEISFILKIQTHTDKI
jgi:hypothetical protein